MQLLILDNLTRFIKKNKSKLNEFSVYIASGNSNEKLEIGKLKTKLLIRSRVKAPFGYNDKDNNLASLKAIMSPGDQFVDLGSENTKGS